MNWFRRFVKRDENGNRIGHKEAENDTAPAGRGGSIAVAATDNGDGGGNDAALGGASSSGQSAVRRAIPLGHSPITGELVEIPVDDLTLPAHIQGPTGHGKTLLQSYIFVKLVESGMGGMFTDFSEDQAAINYMLSNLKKTGRPVHFVSPVSEHDSAWFDPFASLPELTTATAVLYKDFFMAALSLAHKGQHQFWGKINDIALLRTFINLARAGVTRPDFDDLQRELGRVAKALRKNDVIEAQIEIEQLAVQRILQPGDPKKRIDYDLFWEEDQVGVYACSALLNSAAPAIVALHIWAAIAAAMRRRRKGLPRKRLVLNIDEWAMVGHVTGYQLLLVLCRKLGIGPLLLANQSSAQLAETSTEQLVFDNTPTKLWLAPLGDDIETIKGLSREVWKDKVNRTINGLSSTTQIAAFRDPTIEHNEVLSVALTPMQGYYIRLRNGMLEPTPFIFEPPWTLEEWLEFEQTPLPMRDDAKDASQARKPKAATRTKAAESPELKRFREDEQGKLRALYAEHAKRLGIEPDGETCEG